MVHRGKTCAMEWDDGERLMRLCHDVLYRIALPQSFTFIPRGSAAPGKAVTIFVTVDDPIELITNCPLKPRISVSRWFG